MSAAVSVVIASRNRPVLLSRCLDALARQDVDGRCLEVIVVDDGPSAETRAVVERAAARGLRTAYLQTEGGRGPARARNLGWRAAQGQVVAFVDDDCIPAPGWLSAGTSALQDGLAGVGGRVTVPVPAAPTDYEAMTARLERSPFVTANCFYRRWALEQVGGFDERFPLAWREDTDLRFRCLDAGLRLEGCPAAVVEHPVRPAPWGVSIREQRKAMFNALLYKKHPRRYREQFGRPPRHYYVAAGSLAAATGLAANGKRRQASLALALWALHAVWFAAVRLRRTSKRPSHLTEMLVTSAVIPTLSLFWRLAGALRYRVLFL